MSNFSKNVGNNIKIMAPVDKEEEIRVLSEIGVSEVYIQLSQMYYFNRSIMQVELEGLLSDDFKSFVKTAHSFNIPIYVWIEVPIYYEEIFSTLWDVIIQALEAGIDGIITDDVGLISKLNDWDSGIKIVAGSRTQVANIEAGEFLAKIGVSRIVLPSYLSLSEISVINSRQSELEYSWCVYGSDNVYEEGFSNLIDIAENYYRWELEGYNEFYSDDIKNLNYHCTQAIRINELSRKEWIDFSLPMNINKKGKISKRLNCSLCILPNIVYENNIRFFQIGRGILDMPNRIDFIRWVCNAANIVERERNDVPLGNEIKNKHPLDGSCYTIHRCLYMMVS